MPPEKISAEISDYGVNEARTAAEAARAPMSSCARLGDQRREDGRVNGPRVDDGSRIDDAHRVDDGCRVERGRFDDGQVVSVVSVGGITVGGRSIVVAKT